MKHTQRLKALWQASLATLITAGAIALWSGPATAYVACNRSEDCWHTDTHVHFPNVHLALHSEW